MLKIFQIISANIRAILIGLAATSVVGIGLFIRGCQYGEERMDTRWRSQIAMSKPREVGRDTTIELKPQPPQRARVLLERVVSPSGETYQRAIDSLKLLIEAKNILFEDILAPHKSTIESPAIGKLEVTYWPAWKQLTYIHTPPPLKFVKVEVQTERIVLAPRSTWERIQDMAIGGIIVGGLTYLTMEIAK